MRFKLGSASLIGAAMLVQDEVGQLMSSVEPAALRGLEGVEEDIRLTIMPAGKGIHVLRILGQREDTNALRLKQLDHMGDRPLADRPMLA